METSVRERIVIIGGGFAGLTLLQSLDKKLYDVIIVDKHNYHSFPPLFYQVASSGLEPSSISFPFRKEISKMSDTIYHLGVLEYINTYDKTITTQYEVLHYDKLIIATGTDNNFFNMNYLSEKVFTLKSTSQAIRLRNEILYRFELASICKSSERKEQLLTFVIIGGGPSGVEVAGAFGEMKRYIIRREYKNINYKDMKIIIVEGSSRLLHTMSEKSSRNAYTHLKELLVDIKLNKIMSSYEDNIITFSDGDSIYCETLIWTAGVICEKIKGLNNATVANGNRLTVDDYNRIKGYNNIFAIGDIAFMECKEYPKGHPQVAQVAIQQAKRVADNLNRKAFDKPFKYFDKGSMATIGRNRAVVDFKFGHLKGRLAWFVWMTVHLMYILGIRNKIIVFINWVWEYLTYSTSLRLLIRPSKHPERHLWDSPE